MKNNNRSILKVIIITPIIISVLLYLLLAWYYKDTFSYGTWINGVYCTGKNISEINEELVSNAEPSSFEVLLPNGEKEIFSLEEIEYQIDYLKPLELYKKNQNPLQWGANIFKKNGIKIQPSCSYSTQLFEEKIESFSFYKKAVNVQEHKVLIKLTKEGYALSDTRNQVLDLIKTKELIENALISGKSYVNISENDCYYEIALTTKDLETIQLWDKIKNAQNFSSVFVFGTDEEVIDASVVSNWISVNEEGEFLVDTEGNLLIDESKMDEYIYALAEEYNTYAFPREYITIDGREVIISKGNYGNLFDVEIECAYLKNAYKEKIEEYHVPTYIKEALFQGKDDIGSNYIEVDLTNQKMYCVFNGILEIETDVVTGNVNAGMKTTDRICYIYKKQTNRILRGEGYASQVDFWMPIYGGIGIHDAKWRSSFGGEIYIRSGSHGCINTPREFMEEIFENSFIGMPVIMYY